MDFRAFIDSLDDPQYNPFAETATEAVEIKPAAVEVVLDANGHPKQAGADLPEGKWINTFRTKAEGNLYAFAKGILNRNYLSPTLHIQVAAWAQHQPPYRKGLLLPREHAKTSIVSHALPIHILIQPADANIYFPGKAGVDTRILLAGETEKNASNNLSVIEAAYESNRLLRALWPTCVWDSPRKEADRWNKIEMIVPRNTDFPDASIRAVGVGGAITGARHDVHICDDLVTFEAANSAVTMETAIMWFEASRALYDSDSSLEFIVGTRWAVHDLYEYIQANDPTVDWIVRAIVENGEVIYPEKFALDVTAGKIAVTSLQKEQGTMFPLLYMNSAADPDLVDFDMNDTRQFEFEHGEIVFKQDERDALLVEKYNAPATPMDTPRGIPLNSATHDLFVARNEFLRNVRGS